MHRCTILFEDDDDDDEKCIQTGTDRSSIGPVILEYKILSNFCTPKLLSTGKVFSTNFFFLFGPYMYVSNTRKKPLSGIVQSATPMVSLLHNFWT